MSTAASARERVLAAVPALEGLLAAGAAGDEVRSDALAAGDEDGVVERLVAGRLAHPITGQVFRHQGRQDPDHHDVRAVRIRLQLSGVQARADVVLQLQRRATVRLAIEMNNERTELLRIEVATERLTEKGDEVAQVGGRIAP